MPVVPVGVVSLPLPVAAPAVPAVPADGVAAVAVDAGPRGVAEPHLPIGCGGDARTQVLAGRGGGRDQQQEDREAPDPRHWLMTSSRNRAARGSCDWPIQNSAFLRSSRSGSRRAMSISQRRFSAPPIWDSEKMTFSLRSSSVTFAYRPRRYAALSALRCCPSQKMALARASVRTSLRSTYARSAAPARGLCCCDSAKIALSCNSSSVVLRRIESSSATARSVFTWD